MRLQRSFYFGFFLMGLAMLTAACAGTTGSYRPLAGDQRPAATSAFTKLSIQGTANGDVEMPPEARDRILRLVIEKVKKAAPSRFAEFNPAAPDPFTLRAVVTFKRYEKGNAFARFMLAGLGQMHIDADVVLEGQVNQEVLAKYEVTKTFAWGGIYGGSTRIEDLEEGFASAVAKVVLEISRTLFLEWP